MYSYQTEFINFLVESGALTFGDFVTKSGRKTPYFINTGNFNSGARIAKLGHYYAAHIVERGLSSSNVIFGPAYKGIPLCVATSMSLATQHKLGVTFTFDRKEVKDHGDGGATVGHKIVDGDKIIIVEDVITAGTTLREVVPFLKSLAQVEILGVVIAVDRCERGTGSLSAVQETEQNLGVKVLPLVTVHDIVKYLSGTNSSGQVLNEDLKRRIAAYLEEYGAK